MSAGACDSRRARARWHSATALLVLGLAASLGPAAPAAADGPPPAPVASSWWFGSGEGRALLRAEGRRTTARGALTLQLAFGPSPDLAADACVLTLTDVEALSFWLPCRYRTAADGEVRIDLDEQAAARALQGLVLDALGLEPGDGVVEAPLERARVRFSSKRRDDRPDTFRLALEARFDVTLARAGERIPVRLDFRVRRGIGSRVDP